MKKIYLIAAVLALLSGALLFFYLQNLENSKRGPVITEKTVSVVTPVEEIPPYTVLTESMLSVVQVPAASAPTNAIHSIADCVGLAADGTLYPGQYMLDPMLADLSVKAPSLSYVIPEGMRAMTVTVTSYDGTGGYIAAGDHVDLMWYTNREDDSVDYARTAFSRIVADNIQVLAVGNLDYEEGTVYNTLTLALTTDQCREIYIYQNLADEYSSDYGLCALLRNPEDTAPLEHSETSIANIPGRTG